MLELTDADGCAVTAHLVEKMAQAWVAQLFIDHEEADGKKTDDGVTWRLQIAQALATFAVADKLNNLFVTTRQFNEYDVFRAPPE